MVAHRDDAGRVLGYHLEGGAQTLVRYRPFKRHNAARDIGPNGCMGNPAELVEFSPDGGSDLSVRMATAWFGQGGEQTLEQI